MRLPGRLHAALLFTVTLPLWEKVSIIRHVVKPWQGLGGSLCLY